MGVWEYGSMGVWGYGNTVSAESRLGGRRWMGMRTKLRLMNQVKINL